MINVAASDARSGWRHCPAGVRHDSESLSVFPRSSSPIVAHDQPDRYAPCKWSRRKVMTATIYALSETVQGLFKEYLTLLVLGVSRFSDRDASSREAETSANRRASTRATNGRNQSMIFDFLSFLHSLTRLRDVIIQICLQRKLNLLVLPSSVLD